MPSASKKAKSNLVKNVPDNLSTSPDTDTLPVEQAVSSKLGSKKKSRHAVDVAEYGARADYVLHEEVTETASLPTPPPIRSLLSQIQGFPPHQKSPTLSVHDGPTERSPEQQTSFDAQWPLTSAPDEVSTAVQTSEAVTSWQESPPVEPGFSTRNTFSSRSPPISPPQRYVRNVSHGSTNGPLPVRPMMSRSPYSRASSAYGSPPPPHTAQPYFRHAQDVNLGLPGLADDSPAEEPTLVKQISLSDAESNLHTAILLGFPGKLSVIQADCDKLSQIGALANLSGSVVDALLLPNSFVPEHLRTICPLAALVLRCPAPYPEVFTHQERGTIYRPGRAPGLHSSRTTYNWQVVVVSFATRLQPTVLLEITSLPSPVGLKPDSISPSSEHTNTLKLYASNQSLIVASGMSGEVFVFSMMNTAQPEFECLAKFWTAVQPMAQRRDQSHGRNFDTDPSPADTSTASPNARQPIIDVRGRWLAICPAGTPSRSSLEATIGRSISCRKNAGLESSTAPPRPIVSCEVESPDADTLLGKVARGIAQEVVKGARWLGDQGYQAFQNYWKKDLSPPNVQSQPYHPTTYSDWKPPAVFPPTHGEDVQASKEPDLVSIFDLQDLQLSHRGSVTALKPVATFQPPRGCSYLSLAPHGLVLMTVGQKGDVQYIWDLKQIIHCRNPALADEERAKTPPRVRQLVRYERMSESSIVDIAWDKPAATQIAILTKNRTVHLFHLPLSALRWPPSRAINRQKATSKSIDVSRDEKPDRGTGTNFLASAINIASKAQPIVTNWRGRSPSMSAGITGLGQTSLGIASATGARGGRVVATGLSKSLGAASETVNNMRHAGDSRWSLHTTRELSAGRMYWTNEGKRSFLCVVDLENLVIKRVKRIRPDRRRGDQVSTFAASRAAIVRLPKSNEIEFGTPGSTEVVATPVEFHLDSEPSILSGFWNWATATSTKTNGKVPHPLSFAELETSTPYQPFHSDRRVVLSVVASTPQPHLVTKSRGVQDGAQWAFGDDIRSVKVNLRRFQAPEQKHGSSTKHEEQVDTSEAAPGGGVQEIVSTTHKKKPRKTHGDMASAGYEENASDEGFFEDDLEVLDFAENRV